MTISAPETFDYEGHTVTIRCARRIAWGKRQLIVVGVIDGKWEVPLFYRTREYALMDLGRIVHSHCAAAD
jgi:hypothetical protein